MNFRILKLYHFCAFLAELADYADGDFLAFFPDFNRMGDVAVETVEGFIINLDF